MDDKIHLTWDQVSQLSLDLAAKIRIAGEQFDYMVVIPRGGYFVANIVARELDFGPTKLLHACVGSYDAGQNNQRDDIEVGEMPPPDKIDGKSLLVIDEVCDSGETLAFVTKYLSDHGAASITSGVLHYKPANSKNGYVPSWSIEQTDKWIVYPWEEKEFN